MEAMSTDPAPTPMILLPLPDVRRVGFELRLRGGPYPPAARGLAGEALARGRSIA